MSKRKQYIIDKKFQLSTTFTIIGVVSILAAIIIAIIAANLIHNNSRIQEINVKIQNIYEIQNNIVHFLTTHQKKAMDDSPVKEAMSAISQKHFENMQTLAKNMETLDTIIEHNKLLMMALVIFVILQGAILYILIIKKTHRISGPIYVMSNYMKDLLNDKIPEPRKLREKDDLKDFYELFVQLIEKIKSDKEN